MQVVPPTKDISCSPSFVKSLKHGRGGKFANLYLFDNPFPCTLGINDKFVPNAVLNLGLMSLFMIEHFVIAFNSYNPKCNTSKKVPDFDFFSPHIS